MANGISFEETAAYVKNVRAIARSSGRDIGVYTVGVVTCRPTAREAEAYYRHCILDNADWQAVDNILAMRNVSPRRTGRRSSALRNHQANGMGGLPLIGDPDKVAGDMARLAAAGLTGSPYPLSITWTNYPIFAPRYCRG